MTRRIASPTEPAREDRSHDPPLSQLLFRYLWPFWLFQNAARGDHFARAAAYSHNRDMRVYLPGYLFKWTVSTVLALALTRGLASLSSHGDAPDVFLVMAAATGMLFAAGICMLLVTAYI